MSAPCGSAVGPPDTPLPSCLQLGGSNPPVPPLGTHGPPQDPHGPPPLANVCPCQPSPRPWCLILDTIPRQAPPWALLVGHLPKGPEGHATPGRDIPATGLDSTSRTFPVSEAINGETRTFQHRDGPTRGRAMQSASPASRQSSALQWSKSPRLGCAGKPQPPPQPSRTPAELSCVGPCWFCRATPANHLHTLQVPWGSEDLTCSGLTSATTRRERNPPSGPHSSPSLASWSRSLNPRLFSG